MQSSVNDTVLSTSAADKHPSSRLCPQLWVWKHFKSLRSPFMRTAAVTAPAAPSHASSKHPRNTATTLHSHITTHAFTSHANLRARNLPSAHASCAACMRSRATRSASMSLSASMNSPRSRSLTCSTDASKESWRKRARICSAARRKLCAKWLPPPVSSLCGLPVTPTTSANPLSLSGLGPTTTSGRSIRFTVRSASCRNSASRSSASGCLKKHTSAGLPWSSRLK
mmetsp:Transcript_11818/g.28633  ORF Transcript_11818/g.28633 Transcript_11818/m.28633 type:complete len:226 (-) Transcript_11818:299-976(-)